MITITETPYHESLREVLPALQQRAIDLALLPINGRDAYRRSRSILGNFTLAEAVALCQQAQIPLLLAHHFGLFDFNTVNVAATERELAQMRGDRQYSLAQAGVTDHLQNV